MEDRPGYTYVATNFSTEEVRIAGGVLKEMSKPVTVLLHWIEFVGVREAKLVLYNHDERFYPGHVFKEHIFWDMTGDPRQPARVIKSLPVSFKVVDIKAYGHNVDSADPGHKAWVTVRGDDLSWLSDVKHDEHGFMCESQGFR